MFVIFVTFSVASLLVMQNYNFIRKQTNLSAFIFIFSIKTPFVMQEYAKQGVCIHFYHNKALNKQPITIEVKVWSGAEHSARAPPPLLAHRQKSEEKSRPCRS